MADKLKEAFRYGGISERQMQRLAKPAVLRQTKAQPSKMAAFDDKSGKRDQGGVRDRGAVKGNAIDVNQDMGSPARASGKPSKGASVNKTGSVKVAHIDQGEYQRPNFPAGTAVKGANGKRQVGVKGPAPKSSGPQYGGPASRANG